MNLSTTRRRAGRRRSLVGLTSGLARRTRPRDRGATAVEYGLLVALIAAVIVTAVRLFGEQVSSLFSTVLPLP